MIEPGDGLCNEGSWASAGGQWQKASEMFAQMQQQGLTPDVVTYTAVISAYEKGGQWRLALSAYEQMRERGCRPDAIVFNAIIDALWETGVIWAQRKVRHLGTSASMRLCALREVPPLLTPQALPRGLGLLYVGERL